MIGTDLFQSQEPPAGLLCGCMGHRTWPFSGLPSQVIKRKLNRNWSSQDIKLMHVWDAGAIGRGLVHSAMAPASLLLFLKHLAQHSLEGAI